MSNGIQLKQLSGALRRWDWRRRVRDGIIWIPRGVLAGLILALLLGLAARFYPIVTNEAFAYWGGGLAIVGGLIPFFFIFGWRRSLTEQAFFADQQFGLKHRISTALEIQQADLEAGLFGGRQFEDTVSMVGQVDGRVGLPFQWLWREWGVIGVMILLLTAAVLLPNPQEEILLQQKLIEKEIASQIENLESLKEEILANPELTDAQKEELVTPIDQALAQLDGANSQEEGVAALSEATAELEALSEQYENQSQSLKDNLAEAGKSLSQNESTQSLGESLQNGDLAQSAEELAQLAEQIPTMSAAEQAALGESLAQAAASLTQSNPALAEQLQNASEALAAGDSQAAAEALQQASTAMGQTAEQVAQGESAAEAASQASASTNSNQQQLAQAGQPQSGQTESGEGQTGEGQQAQGEGAGEQGVSSLQQGQGQGQGEGTQPGQGQSGQTGQEGGSFGGTSEGGGHVESIYVPPLVDLSGEAGVDVQLPAECKENPSLCGPIVNESATQFGDESSQVPYNQVFGDYQDAAGEALNNEYIPLGLKEFVKDYFSSLEP